MDGLERDWADGQVIRLDIATPVGRGFGELHNFRFTPTFLLFDGDGQEIARWGRPPSLAQLQEATQ